MPMIQPAKKFSQFEVDIKIKLKRVREKRKITREQMAGRLNCTTRRIDRIESYLDSGTHIKVCELMQYKNILEIRKSLI